MLALYSSAATAPAPTSLILSPLPQLLFLFRHLANPPTGQLEAQSWRHNADQGWSSGRTCQVERRSGSSHPTPSLAVAFQFSFRFWLFY